MSIKLMKQRWLSEVGDARNDLNDVIDMEIDDEGESNVEGDKKIEDERQQEEKVKIMETVVKQANINENKTSEKSDNENIQPAWFEKIEENVILCDENLIKEAKVVRCFCEPTENEITEGRGCGPGCINRDLYTECGSRCPSGPMCSNRRFRNKEYANVEVFHAGIKGWGLRAAEPIEPGRFIIEYVGEVIDSEEMQRRGRRYGKDPKHIHHYLMALKNGAVIDATQRGNISRFINHSCDPNCESQKWAVDRQLRVGFFSIRSIKVGEEIVFDYQLERYGRKAQRCFCGASNCRGLIGEDTDSDDDEKEDNDYQESDNDGKIPEQNGLINVRITPEEAGRKTRKKKKRMRNMDLAIMAALKRGAPTNRVEVQALVQLMIQVEQAPQRCKLIKCMQFAHPDVLRIFMQNCGLRLLYVFLATDYPVDDRQYVYELMVASLDLLQVMPIINRNQVNDSHLAATVQKLANKIGPIDEIVEERVRHMINVISGDSPSTSESSLPGTSCCIDETLENLHFSLVCKARNLMLRWNRLREEFRIPRREKSGTPDDANERIDKEEKLRRRSVLQESGKKVENSWKTRRIVLPQRERNNDNRFIRKRGFSPTSSGAEAVPSRRSRFDVVSKDADMLSSTFEGYTDENEEMYVIPPPPMLLPESLFAAGLPTLPYYPPFAPYDWNAVYGVYDSAYQHFDYQQQQYNVHQEMNLKSILEAPSPPANIPKVSTESCDSKKNLLVIEPIDLDKVTDEQIEMMEKHLALIKEKRAERKKKELENATFTAPPPPPPSTPPKKSKWIQATTEEGTVYYYNKETRESSWTLPDEGDDAADTTSDRNDSRAIFKATIARHVANILDPIRKAKFSSSDDYKYVLRKLTHTILEKELKRIGEGELKVTDSVKEKARRYVSDYITRLGDGQYCRKNKQHNAY